MKNPKQNVTKVIPIPSKEAKEMLANLWLDFDGNEAKAILKAFKIGFTDGVQRARKAKP